jgi:spermidine/putrescine transport system permease protein
VFTDPIFLGALETSVKVATATAIVGGVLGTLAAFALSRPFRGRGLLRALLVAPLAMPGLITGVAMLNFFVSQSIQLSIATVILGHLVYATPFVVLAMTARLAELDPALQEAGRDLGRGVFGVFRTITLPLIFPAVAGAALVAAALSLDEVIITNFVSGSTVTLPLFIWAKLRTGVTPDTNAACTSIVVALSVIVIVSYALSRLVSSQRSALLVVEP